MIVLSKDMEVGVKKIDDQHRELIDRINAVTSMGVKSVSTEETLKTINLLGDYIVKHFNDEENLQIQSGYPDYAVHKKQHELLIAEYKKIKNAFEAEGPSIKFTLDLNKSLVEWIVRHIKSVDIKFGKYYNAQNK
ncbi:MAG: bacteriohemerythrin [Chitinivibrionia bacterium]|nr:bacteriohemerythrin [Chitinivibrionia bacterium]